jgi:hypothetical protein
MLTARASGDPYLLLWVAALLVIFQTPSIRSIEWKSRNPLDLSGSKSQLRWTLAASPTWVTEMIRPTTPELGGEAHPSKHSEMGHLTREPSGWMKKIQASSWKAS